MTVEHVVLNSLPHKSTKYCYPYTDDARSKDSNDVFEEIMDVSKKSDDIGMVAQPLLNTQCHVSRNGSINLELSWSQVGTPTTEEGTSIVYNAFACDQLLCCTTIPVNVRFEKLGDNNIPSRSRR